MLQTASAHVARVLRELAPFAILVAASLVVIFTGAIAAADVVSRKFDPQAIRYIFELLYFAGGILLALTACMALRFARAQVSQAQLANAESVRSYKARMFLEIEKSWASDDLVRSRKAVKRLRGETLADCPPEDLGERVHAIVSEMPAARYMEDFHALYFLETIGLMVRPSRKYIDIDEVVSLYHPAISEYSAMFKTHLEKRFREWAESQDVDDPARLNYRDYEEGTFANALFLFDECHRIARLKSQPHQRTSSGS